LDRIVDFASFSTDPAIRAESVVFVVDDDDSVRQSLVTLMRSVRLHAEGFASASEFLAQAPARRPACVILDVRLPGLSGLDLQREMAERKLDLPIVFITGHGTIPMTVKAMKAGAVEFLVKPLDEEELLDAVRQGLWMDWTARQARVQTDALLARVALLSPREREIFCHVAAGRLIKQTAADLGLSEVTVKVHRRKLMDKMAVTSVADLVRIAERLNLPRL
jgi:FixJ family two-component response regulator